MITIHKEPDAKTAATNAAMAITEAVMQSKKDGVLLLFSGGSPLEIVKVLSLQGYDSQVTIGVSDERFSADSTINNFAQIQAMDWYAGVSSQGVGHIDTRPLASETVEEAGVRFDLALKHWRDVHPEGKIIITQGIGLDGHTAGMMPARQRPEPQAMAGGPYPDEGEFFTKTFVDTINWAVGYDAKGKNKYPLRVTTTVPFLKQVDLSIIYVCGQDKLKPLTDVLASFELVSYVPGRIIHQMKHCLLYTDQTVDKVIV